MKRILLFSFFFSHCGSNPTAATKAPAADIPTAPASPTWASSIQTIFADNCVSCHGSPAKGGAPSSFRLDQYATVDNVKGAKDMAGSCATQIKSGRMPQGATMGSNSKMAVQNWVDAGAPEK